MKNYMRSLHRDIGFLVVGMTIIYSISGVLLIYRDTGFLKSEKQVEKKLAPGISESELGMKLHLRNFKVMKTEGDILHFKNGTYNKASGVAKYTENKLPAFLEKLTHVHKISSKSTVHWITAIYGLALLFLAISSFWMHKPKTKLFRRGMFFAAGGSVIAIILLFV